MVPLEIKNSESVEIFKTLINILASNLLLLLPLYESLIVLPLLHRHSGKNEDSLLR